MDITGKIEEVNQSDSLLLVVFYADWSPHCEWIEPLLHEFEKPVNIVRVNIESNRKVADAYEIEIAPSFVLQRKGKMLWEKTGEVFPGELRDVIRIYVQKSYLRRAQTFRCRQKCNVGRLGTACT